MSCPICKRQLLEAKFAICKYWECKEEVSLDSSRMVHYRKILYNDGAIQCKYIFPPFFITSTEKDSVVTLLRQSIDRSSRENRYVSDKKIQLSIPLILDDVSSGYLLDKLKLYTTFS